MQLYNDLSDHSVDVSGERATINRRAQVDKPAKAGWGEKFMPMLASSSRL